MPHTTKLCIALGSAVLLFGCSSANQVRYVRPYPASWIKEQIEAYERPASDVATRVMRKVTYAGQPAYLIPSPCCDKYDFLYDAKGTILCAPSGGFAGGGDGSCPEVL